MAKTAGSIAALVALVFIGGCATSEPFEPFPRRNTDARVGFIRNLGTTHLNMWVYDEANRLIEEWYLAPAQDPLSPLAVDQRRSITSIVKTLPPGRYRVVAIPFYYRFYVFSGRQRIDLPKFSTGFTVGRDPTGVYDRETGRHWGWVLQLYGGDMPRDPLLQNINFSIRCC